MFLLCVLPPGVSLVLSQEAHTKASAFKDKYIDVDIFFGGDKIPSCLFICTGSHLCACSVGLGPSWPAAWWGSLCIFEEGCVCPGLAL